MAERASPVLAVRNLNLYYGGSHALQGVDLSLGEGVLAVVGRNGMGKTSLCKAIMGLVPIAGGSISFAGESLVGWAPADIAKLGIGYVPQGRRLWRSLTVDEHLRLVARRGGAWTTDRIYQSFPRLAERRQSTAAQLSGGEQQMLAISRALLQNPRLLIMDEPTEGLAPVIVERVEAMLSELAQEGQVEILLIEQNIKVATSISDRVAIMVNGRISRIMDSMILAADRDLQQRLLGVGRHGEDDRPDADNAGLLPPDRDRSQGSAPESRGVSRIYVSNPVLPTRWSQPASLARIENAARAVSSGPLASVAGGPAATLRQTSTPVDGVVLVAGTLDTKGAELRFVRDILKLQSVRTQLVDLSTSGRPSGADVPPHQVALHHPRGGASVFSQDRGEAVTAMAEAFEIWIRARSNIAGIIGAGGSGGTSLVTPAMRALPIGVPKIMISTVASGDVGRYVGPADIMMLHAVADVQGLNRITRQVLTNGAEAMAGMVKARRVAQRHRQPAQEQERPAIGLTMFGVTTPAVQQIVQAFANSHDCLVFHATGTGGRAMEKLAESRMLEGVIDITTTEVADLVLGGVFPADQDRFGAIIRTGMPYVGACGALDMVNFGPIDTLPPAYANRTLYRHNPQVTLMRTTPAEAERMGAWIGERLNAMNGQVRFFLPEGGLSALDAPGQPFFDPAADRALFDSLERTVRQNGSRRLLRRPEHINDPAFALAVVEAYQSLRGRNPARRQKVR